MQAPPGLAAPIEKRFEALTAPALRPLAITQPGAASRMTFAAAVEFFG